MLCAGMVGLLITALSLRGRMSGLMVLWTLTVFGTLVYGFYLSNYKYDDWDHFRTSLNITAGAFVALVASVTGLFRDAGCLSQRRSGGIICAWLKRRIGRLAEYCGRSSW